MSAKSLPSRPSLDHLKYQAKDLLNACQASNPDALVRIREFHPKFRDGQPPAKLSLNDAQLVIAREYGFESWPKLRRQVEQLASAQDPVPEGNSGDTADSHARRVQWFLENACPDHHVRGGADHIMARNTALRLLRRHPEIARASIHTAAVCGELAEVTRILKERPGAASEKSATPDAERGGSGGSGDVLYRQLGPKGWEPLLYLCFTRLDLPIANDNAAAIARQLLDHGANPNVYFQAGGSRYTPLVGVIGEGEEGRLPHPQRDALARLLVERGAEPFDMQVLYNIHFNGQVLWFLKLIHELSVKAGRQAAWNDPEWQMLGMGNYGSGARFLLQVAIDHNDIELAEWCLTHGANPNAAPPQAKNLPQGSLRDEALRRGLHELADLLLRHGATPGEALPPTNLQRFIGACLRRDFTQARELLAGQPELQTAPEPATAAAAQDRVDVLQFLLELGLSLNLPDPKQGNQRPLHVAAYSDAPAAAAFLLQHGAEVDAREANWGATPLSFAIWGQKQRAIDTIAPFSRDPWNLAFTGHVTRLRELLAAQPALAKAAYSDGETPLMRLPDDDAKAVETAKLLLAHGADPAARNKKGMTAAELARKRGLDEAADLIEKATQPVAPQPEQPRDLNHYEQVASAMVRVFDAEDAEALQHYNAHYHRSFTRDDLRAEVWRRVRVVREASNRGHKNPFAVAEARELLARDAGYSGWSKLAEALAAGTPPGPAHDIDVPKKRISPRRMLNPSEWDTLLGVMKEQGITTLEAHGQMTDTLLERVARLDHVTGLDLGGSRQLTDDGLRHLAKMPQLERLDLSEYPGGKLTDRGLAVLRHLPSLKVFQMCWQSGISDAGVAHLAHCEHLENVNLLSSPTGDGALRALRGKQKLQRLNTGRLVTDAGLPCLQEIPRFQTWAGGEIKYGLMGAEAKPTHLLLDGPVTDQGLGALAGLDGLFALSFFWHVSALTPEALAPLKHLPKLGFLGCEGKLCNDTAMRHIAAIPALRMLMGQGTVASDDGFEALSKSSTLEYIWGRECPNLKGRGFRALVSLPALRGLAVSCKNVDDDSLALLPRFPALRELVPMDVPDAGFHHVGQCAQLEKLICMYCRDTTDAATEHVKHLTRLKTYYAGATQITDRSLEILGGISSLEKIEFYECKGVTDAGLPFLARLPKLREVEFGGLPNVTLAGTTVFPASVRVRHSS